MSRNIFWAKHLHYFILVGVLMVLGRFCDAVSQPRKGVIYTPPGQCPVGEFGRSCLSCECSGVTHDCQAAKLVYKSISVMDTTWRLANSHGIVSWMKPDFLPDSNPICIAYSQGDSAAFWLAPKIYSGNRLSSYGTNFTFNVLWHVSEDEITDVALREPLVILISNQGLRIGYYGVEDVISETTYTVPLEEFGWFHVRANGKSLLLNPDYIDRPVTRSAMLKVLINLKYLMIRTRYKADQLFSGLWSPSLLIGTPSFFGAESLVEQCHCPEGYSGLSCENCASGYEKIVNGPPNRSHQCIRETRTEPPLEK